MTHHCFVSAPSVVAAAVALSVAVVAGRLAAGGLLDLVGSLISGKPVNIRAVSLTMSFTGMAFDCSPFASNTLRQMASSGRHVQWVKLTSWIVHLRMSRRQM